MLPPRRPAYRNELVCATRRYADKLSAGSMQSHNLQHAPARYVLHFFQIFKEQTPTNDITYMSIKKSAMKTRPAGHHHDLLLVSVHCDGGAGRDRTDDLRLAKPPLSQLSYSPSVSSNP